MGFSHEFYCKWLININCIIGLGVQVLIRWLQEGDIDEVFIFIVGKVQV